MFRTGIVKAQDVPNLRVRVTFPAHDQLTSWWLPVVMPKTQDDKFYAMPDVGEQVVCFMDEHDENGAVLGSIYSTADQPPAQMNAEKWHVTMKDGATMEYDRAQHILTINIPPDSSALNVTINGTINLIASNSNINLSAPNGDVTFTTNEHQTSVNNIVDAYQPHTHQFTDSQGDTGPTQSPLPQIQR